MNETQEAWGNIKIHIGGRKIEPITSMKVSINGSEEAGIKIDNKIYCYTGTITLAKEDMCQLRKICMGKKAHLPRKLKKKLQKLKTHER